MTDPRAADTTPLNPPDVPVEDIPRELAGREAHDDQDGILATDQVELVPTMTDEAVNAEMGGALGRVSRVDSPESLEMLEDLDARADETNDPNLAAEEGMTYIPPVDPPVVPSSDPEGAVVAAGFATSARDVPYDADHHQGFLSAEDERTDRVREALRADATTTEFADRLEIETEAGVVTIRGTVEDLDDDDNVVAVASSVTGVDEVVDELEIAAL